MIGRNLQRAWYGMRGYYPARMEKYRFRVRLEDRKFWRTLASGEWEHHTFRILDSLLQPDSLYLDFGAWIGPTVLYAARQCRHVFCLEPDAEAYERLLSNLRLNRIENVSTFHGAMHTHDGSVTLHNPRIFGNSETRVGSDGSVDLRVAPCLTWRSAMAMWQEPQIDVLKMDVEGAEFDLLPTLKSDLDALKPALYLSTHASFFDATQRKGKMKTIQTIAESYIYRYDRNLKTLELDELAGPDYTDQPSELVLSMVPLSKKAVYR